MIYVSTRDGQERATASQAILKGLANDGGLFVPERIPALDVPLSKLGDMTYQQYLDQLQAAGSKSRRANILRLAARDPDLSGAEFVDLVHMVYPKE